MPALPVYVYRCYDADGRLLYIGCSSNPGRRIAQHIQRQHRSPWAVDIATYRLEGPYEFYEGLRQERAAIEAEGPLHNIRWNRVRSIATADP